LIKIGGIFQESIIITQALSEKLNVVQNSPLLIIS
jgi:hypothetical protein